MSGNSDISQLLPQWLGGTPPVSNYSIPSNTPRADRVAIAGQESAAGNAAIGQQQSDMQQYLTGPREKGAFQEPYRLAGGASVLGSDMQRRRESLVAKASYYSQLIEKSKSMPAEEQARFNKVLQPHLDQLNAENEQFRQEIENHMRQRVSGMQSKYQI